MSEASSATLPKCWPPHQMMVKHVVPLKVIVSQVIAPEVMAPEVVIPPGYSSPGPSPPGYSPPGYSPPGYGPPGYSPPGYSLRCAKVAALPMCVVRTHPWELARASA